MRYVLTVIGPVLLLSAYAITSGHWSLPAVLVLNTVLFGWGTAVGFHKVFSHNTHQPSAGVQLLLLLAGTAAGQGSSLSWKVAHERYHHRGVTHKRLRSPTSLERLSKWFYLLSSRSKGNASALKRMCDPKHSPICSWHTRIDRDYLQWFYGLGALLALTVSVIALHIGMIDTKLIEYLDASNKAGLPPPDVFAVLHLTWVAIAYGIGSWSLAVALSFVQSSIVVTLGYKPINEWPLVLRPWFVNRRYVTNDDTVNLPVLAWVTWGQTLCNNHSGRPYRYCFSCNKETCLEESLTATREVDPTTLVEPILRYRCTSKKKQ